MPKENGTDFMTGQDAATADDYRLLGLRPGASPEEVKRAYRALVKRWHPDRYAGGSERERAEAEEKFKDLQDAYRRILSKSFADAFSSREVPSGKKTHTAADRGAKESGDGSQGKKPFSTPQATQPSGLAQALKTLRSRAGAWAEKPMGSGKRAAAAAVLLLAVLWGYWLHAPRPKEAPSGAAPGATTGSESPKAPEAPASNLSIRVDDALSSPAVVPGYDPAGREILGGPSPAGAGKAETFTLGSSEKDVLRVQGPPDKAGGGRWSYGLSEVRFQDGRVTGYDNFDGRLRVALVPSAGSGRSGAAAANYFTLGSTKDDVLRVQGTPTGVRGAVWHYGFSSVRFSEDRVVSYDNSFGNLKVRLVPSREYLEKAGGTAPSFFTVGSSADEVLAVQGTPTSIRGNMWFYDFSDVLFRDGRVGWVNDPGGRLRFVPKEVLSEPSAVNPK